MPDKIVKLCLNCGLSAIHECLRKRRRGYRRCFFMGIKREVNNNSTCNDWIPDIPCSDKKNK